MRTRNNNLENLIARSGLYRIWVPVREDGTIRLLARWIKAQPQGVEQHENDDSSGSEEPGGIWRFICLQCA